MAARVTVGLRTTAAGLMVCFGTTVINSSCLSRQSVICTFAYDDFLGGSFASHNCPTHEAQPFRRRIASGVMNLSNWVAQNAEGVKYKFVVTYIVIFIVTKGQIITDISDLRWRRKLVVESLSLCDRSGTYNSRKIYYYL